MLKIPFPAPARPRAVAAEHMKPWIIALSVWLGAGCVALTCVPALRGYDPLFGWLPFWLVIAPAIDLAVLRRRRLIARTHELLAHVGRRRRNARQARPMRRRMRTARRSTRAETAAR